MSTFKVEKNIKVPALRGRPTKYPFPMMQKGDSFFVPNGAPRGLHATAYNFGKRHKMKFTVRSVQEKDVVGVRIWRTA